MKKIGTKIIDGTPAGYPRTATKEIESKNILMSLLNPTYIKGEINVLDKYPNSDGVMEITNFDQIPVGKIDIQLKTLEEKNYKRPCYQCQKSLFSYAEHSALPVIIVVVNRHEKKAYWRHIDDETLIEVSQKLKGESLSLNIPAENCIDGINEDYIAIWTEKAQHVVAKVWNQNSQPGVFDKIDNSKSLIKAEENKLEKLTNLKSSKKLNELIEELQEMLLLPQFARLYGKKIDDLIFSDEILLEHMVSESPHIVIEFATRYIDSGINRGENLFFILRGLFSNKMNPIYHEIKKYKEESEKYLFFSNVNFEDFSEFRYDENKDYGTSLPIIKWLAKILTTHPYGLKETSKYFLNDFGSVNDDNYNRKIFSQEEVELSCARDFTYSTLQLFRVLLVEISFINARKNRSIDRILPILYGAFNYVLDNTEMRSKDVALNNDSYTLNEYFLNYIFCSYLSLLVLSQNLIARKPAALDNVRIILRELFSKVDRLIESESISDASKYYYVEELVEFYFKQPNYYNGRGNQEIETIDNLILWQLHHSLTDSPYGNVAKFQQIFTRVCKRYEFYRSNKQENIFRAQHFYNYLLPFTHGLEWRITEI